MIPAPPAHLAHRAGRSALCDRMIEGTCIAREVRLDVLGPVGIVTLQCWLCPACQPTPATMSATSATLLRRVLGWYRATPSAWPILRLAES